MIVWLVGLGTLAAIGGVAGGVGVGVAGNDVGVGVVVVVVTVQVVHDVGGGLIWSECKELLSSTVTLGGPQPQPL